MRLTVRVESEILCIIARHATKAQGKWLSRALVIYCSNKVGAAIAYKGTRHKLGGYVPCELDHQSGTSGQDTHENTQRQTGTVSNKNVFPLRSTR